MDHFYGLPVRGALQGQAVKPLELSFDLALS